MTPDEVDELYSRVNGVRNDLVALVSTVTDNPSALLIENALANIHRAIDLTAKLMVEMGLDS